MGKSERYRQAAELHATNIDQGFLATLGVPFLALMYQTVDEGDESVLLTEEIDGRVVGFVAGGMGMKSIYRRMLCRPLWLGWALLPSLVRPRRIKRILNVLRYGSRNADDPTWPKAELLSIAVDPAARGTGVAERLYRQLEVHFRERGERSFRIVVGASLAPAHRYYLRMGAEPVGRLEVHQGEVSVLYVQSLGPL